MGGNQKFYDFMQEYSLHDALIQKKYDNRSARFYKKRLWHEAEGREFKDQAPPRTIEEAYEQTKTAVFGYGKEGIEKSKVAVQAISDKKQEAQEKGYFDKVKGAFVAAKILNK